MQTETLNYFSEILYVYKYIFLMKQLKEPI